ncbi:pentapeptide repeat-containing protein [Synechococcus sp. NOUM97013]|uniref:pentapeptide repeat-containing protein n=1 Tax=Synechococcus sp. NOUM97013 TaxID=1442555 RepID=UPI0016456DC7|nr:pentapeptide repeat-containing protein [Synechococcus sp. NOUM97013]
MANANWFYYFDSDPFSETTPIEKAEDCDCDKPGTPTDSLIGPLESFFGKEAEDDEIIGAESLPTTYQGPGVRWQPEWFPDGARRNFFDANLSWADLREADLRNAFLIHADLREADLRGADLWRADLRSADLRGADLERADLRDADLWRAFNLGQARNAFSAIYYRTTCPDGSMNIGTWPCFGDQLIPA